MLKKLVIPFLLLIIFAASSWSLFHSGFFRAHDFIHAARIAEMTRALQEGQFPVRWSNNFGYGYGMPLFEFYAPLPFYVGSLFYWLGLGVIPSVKLLFLISSLLTMIGAYKLGNKLFGGTGGVLTAAALTLAPYRAVNLFVRGAISEAWGIMALPWILYGIVLLVNSELQSIKAAKKQSHRAIEPLSHLPKSGFLILTISLVTLMLSHNLTTLMFVPISFGFGILYLVFSILYTKQKSTFKLSNLATKQLLLPAAYLLLSYCLAIGLSAFYLFPALAEKSFTQIDSILSGYFHYSHHFLYIRQFLKPNWGYGGSQWGPDDGISFFLGLGQLLGLVITTSFLIKKLFSNVKIQMPNYKQINKRIKTKTNKISQLFNFSTFQLYYYVLFATPFVLSLFLTLLKSKPLWDTLPLINYIQFPWRWMSVAIMFLALLVGMSVTFIKNKMPARLNMRSIFGGAILALLLLNSIYFRPESYLDNADDLYYTDELRIRRDMSGILPDYISSDLKISSCEQPKVRIYGVDTANFLCEEENSFLCVGQVCDKQIDILVDRGHEKLIRTHFKDSTRVDFKVAYYPGWETEFDGKKSGIKQYKSQIGNIVIDVPAGEHTVGIRFNKTPVRFWSDVVSAISFLVLLGIIVKQEIKKT